MIISDLGRAGAVLLMLGRPWQSEHLAFLPCDVSDGVVFLLLFRPARAAVLKMLLPKKDIDARKMQLMTSGMQITGLIGPALGGVLLATIHRQGVFIFRRRHVRGFGSPASPVRICLFIRRLLPPEVQEVSGEI